MKLTKSHLLKTTMHLFYAVIMVSFIQLPAFADSAAKIDKEVQIGLTQLYASSTKAKELSKVAKGILIFPDVLKAGLLIGAQYGEGALLINEKTAGYYNTVATSY